MPSESDGFAPEPTYPLAEQAEIGQLKERLYAAQNALAKRDAAHLNPCERCNGSGSEPGTDPDEAAGLVLVGREDLRRGVAFGRSVGYPAPGIVDVLDRLSDAAGSAPSGHPTSPESDAGHAPRIPGTPDAQEGSQRAGGDRT